MAYFQKRHTEESEAYTRRFSPMNNQGGAEEDSDGLEYEDEYEESYREAEAYDDGLDEDGNDFMNWNEEDEDSAEDEWTEEELAEERKRKFRIAAGVGDLTAILVGTAVILALAALLIQMYHFVTADISQNFTIWATHF